jgi:hypothetical protein
MVNDAALLVILVCVALLPVAFVYRIVTRTREDTGATRTPTLTPPPPSAELPDTPAPAPTPSVLPAGTAGWAAGAGPAEWELPPGEQIGIVRPRVPNRPPWEPAPKPPDLP